MLPGLAAGPGALAAGLGARAMAEGRWQPVTFGASWCLPCRLLAACLDHAVFQWMQYIGYAIPEPWPEAAVRRARALRLPVLLCLLALLLAVAMQLWCVGRGWYLLARGTAHACRPLQHWLLGYCVALTMVPFCFAVAGPLVVWWAANGTLIRSSLPTPCQQSSPGLWAFVDEVLFTSLATCGCMLVAYALMWCIRRHTRQMYRLWGSAGPAHEAAVRGILADPAPDVPAGSECIICLEEGRPQSVWRRLRCGHEFHECCLLEWLQRARRCPLCRMDLHAAYLSNAPALANGAPAAMRASVAAV